jgi:NAD(P)H-dependent flavin oxidoreductase YrpB (nitropropane dioxygenase family)
MLSFGDPRPFAEMVRRSGAVLIIQVTDLAEARRAAGALIGTRFLATAVCRRTGRCARRAS